jgi:hypothetical protein
VSYMARTAILTGTTMTIELDEKLIFLTKRRTREGGLSDVERIAINLFKRRGVKVPVLAKVFNVSKNTIYYKSLTGDADSYPNSQYSNSAADTNALIERMGVEAAWETYIRPEWIGAVNAENAREVARRERASAAKEARRKRRRRR